MPSTTLTSLILLLLVTAGSALSEEIEYLTIPFNDSIDSYEFKNSIGWHSSGSVLLSDARETEDRYKISQSTICYQNPIILPDEPGIVITIENRHMLGNSKIFIDAISGDGSSQKIHLDISDTTKSIAVLDSVRGDTVEFCFGYDFNSHDSKVSRGSWTIESVSIELADSYVIIAESNHSRTKILASYLNIDSSTTRVPLKTSSYFSHWEVLSGKATFADKTQRLTTVYPEPYAKIKPVYNYRDTTAITLERDTTNYLYDFNGDSIIGVRKFQFISPDAGAYRIMMEITNPYGIEVTIPHLGSWSYPHIVEDVTDTLNQLYVHYAEEAGEEAIIHVEQTKAPNYNTDGTYALFYYRIPTVTAINIEGHNSEYSRELLRKNSPYAIDTNQRISFYAGSYPGYTFSHWEHVSGNFNYWDTASSTDANYNHSITIGPEDDVIIQAVNSRNKYYSIPTGDAPYIVSEHVDSLTWEESQTFFEHTVATTGHYLVRAVSDGSHVPVQMSYFLDTLYRDEQFNHVGNIQGKIIRAESSSQTFYFNFLSPTSRFKVTIQNVPSLMVLSTTEPMQVIQNNHLLTGTQDTILPLVIRNKENINFRQWEVISGDAVIEDRFVTETTVHVKGGAVIRAKYDSTIPNSEESSVWGSTPLILPTNETVLSPSTPIIQSITRVIHSSTKSILPPSECKNCNTARFYSLDGSLLGRYSYRDNQRFTIESELIRTHKPVMVILFSNTPD